MKILWIASWFPSEISPFNGDFVERMAKRIGSNYDVTVLNVEETIGTEKDIFSESSSYYLVQTIFSSKSYKRTFWTHSFRFVKYLKAYKKGIKIIEKKFGKPDIIHLHGAFPAGIFAWFYSILSGIPLIYTEHWSGLLEENQHRLFFVQRYLVKLIGKQAKFILPVSHYLKRSMQSMGVKGNYIVVPNVVNTDLFAPQPKEPLNDNFIFIHVSNLHDKVKNVSGIIHAFKKATIRFNHFRLIIIGEGPDEKKIISLVNELNLEKKVFFKGQIPYEDVAEEIRHAHCFVLFSRYETFSCVLLEAMCVGLPVISSKCGGVSEWIDEKDGILVEVDDVSALGSAMEKMGKEYKNFNPRIRREKVEKCGIEQVGNQISEIYFQSLNSR